MTTNIIFFIINMKDVTIITFNQSLNYGLELMRKFELEGISTSFFLIMLIK